MRRIVILLVILFSSAIPSGAVNYYVSPSGNDDADGLTPATAWRTIDNGDSLLYPGDTVYVRPGTYTDSVVITDSGSIDARIVYLGVRDSTLLDASSISEGVIILGSFITWSGISVKNATLSNIRVNGGSNLIRMCHIESAISYGIHLDKSEESRFEQNVIANNGVFGIYLLGNSNTPTIVNNTFYNNSEYGVYCLAPISYLTNNIFEGHGKYAVKASQNSQLTYSIFHNNAANVTGGVDLGSGCLVDDPMMINPAGDNFRLSSGSPAINAGIDVGLPFYGAAPDMGAYETKPLISLTITPVYDSLFADSSYQFMVIALDNEGAPADPGILTWSHTFPTGTIDSSGLFSPDLIGQGKIIVASSLGGISDTSTNMRVVPGRLHTLSVIPSRDTISSDSTSQFSANGFDGKGNTVSYLGNLSWAVINPIGTINPSGLFSAGKTGPGFIKVTSDLSVIGVSDTILVIPGKTNFIDVLPPENIVVEQTPHQYLAYGYDADSNLVRNLTDSVVWATTDTSGRITTGGLYTAGDHLSPPDYYVRATYLITLSDSGRVTVTSSGTLGYIRVEWLDGTPFDDTTLTTDDDATTLYCRGYDSSNNLMGNMAVTWSIIGVDSIGTVLTGPTAHTTLTLCRIGTGRVIATYAPSIKDTTGIITCQHGIPTRLVIAPDSATICIDSSMQFTSNSFDADGNPSNQVVISSWSVLGGIGTITASGFFTPSAIGVGFIASSGGGLADTTGPIAVISCHLSYINVLPDSTVVSSDSVKQFTVIGYDSHGSIINPGTITWGLTAPLGNMDSYGLFEAKSVGVGKVTALSSLGPVDTTSLLQVIPGRLVELAVSPDSAEISVGQTIGFQAIGTDSDGNTANVGNLTWKVIGDIGTIDPSGLFTASKVGSGRIAVTSNLGNITDTNHVVIVLPNTLAFIIISPDTASLKIDQTIRFVAHGFDAMYAPVDVGKLTWRVLGGIGTIDTNGVFTATVKGAGKVMVTSSINAKSDTTNMIVVELPRITEIPLGNAFVRPNQSVAPILAFRISNAFEETRNVQGITVRNASKGAGSQAELLSNIDSIALYVDSNHNLELDPDDSLLTKTEVALSTIPLSFSPLAIAPGSDRVFIVSVKTSLFSRDSDSLDMFLLPVSDIQTNDGSLVAGPDTINSLGYDIIDGMIADQVSIVSSGNKTISPGAQPFHVLTVDVPRNGYQNDTLQIFTIYNAGSAKVSDIDSLILYQDDGNGDWGGSKEELPLGILSFTGAQWELSGLSVPLNQPAARFFLGVMPSQYATNGATLSLGIPLKGLEMSSDNDGPIDLPILPKDTISILTSQLLSVRTMNIPSREIIPGEKTGPIVGIEFVNGYSGGVKIDSIRFNLFASDPDGATQEKLDSQIDSVMLWLNRDGDYSRIGDSDSLIGLASMSGSTVFFKTNGITVPGHGGAMGIFLEAQLNKNNSKNDNLINFGLSIPTDIYFDPSVTISGSFPLLNQDDFVINAFPASNVTVNAVSGQTIFGGQKDRLVFDFQLPKNGYADDILRSLKLVNTGTSAESDALSAIKLWADTDDNGFSASDVLLGKLASKNGYWEITGLTYPLRSVTNRFLITADVTSGNFLGGTLRFEIPIQGVEYGSGTNGPDDHSVGNPESHFLFPPNRITAISIPQEASTVYPGTVGAVILPFALYNGYVNQTHHLEAIRLSNQSRSASTGAFADHELGQVSLYHEQNANRSFDYDSLLAVGYFNDQKLSFNGFSIPLASESLSYFFVVADLPLDLIDSDTLTITVEEQSDFVFQQTANINGDLPLSRGGPLVVDGSVLEQFKLIPVVASVLSPGDKSVPLFAFRPACNGDLPDTFNSLSLSNQGNADTSDIVSLKLWLDRNGDNLWQPSDSLLGQFVYASGNYLLNQIRLKIENPAPIVFVTGDVTSWATPNSYFQAMIPVNGCQYTSANDGPHDSPLISPQILTISSSSLRLTYDPLKPKYSVGQHLKVKVNVTNLSSTPLDSVFCKITATGDVQIMQLDSSFVGPVTLSASQTASFYHQYTGIQPGTNFWKLQAFSTTKGESSAVVQTEPVTMQTVPEQVQVQMISSIPTSVIRGQSHVYPLSIKCLNSANSPLVASLQLDSLRLRIEDGSGAAQPANQVFSRMVLATGYNNLAIVESFTSEPTVLLAFSQPAILSPGDELLLSLRVDIDSVATAAAFALTIENASAITFVDQNTGNQVPIDPKVTFPLKTASCRINTPSYQMAVSYVPTLSEFANYGQKNVSILKLALRHSGEPDRSPIQFTSLSLDFVDDQWHVINPSDLFDEVKLLRGQNEIGRLSAFDAGTTRLTIPLSAPPVISPGQTDTIELQVTIQPQSADSIFGVLISDSTFFTLRDLSSGSMVLATSDTALATAPVFPIFSGLAKLKSKATAPLICMTSKTPDAVIAGSDSITLVELILNYPVAQNFSAITMKNVWLNVLDTLGLALDPYQLFDRVGFRVLGGPVQYEPFIQLKDGYMVFYLGSDGITVPPGDSASVQLVADIQADAPFGHFLLRMNQESAIWLTDATDTTNHPGFATSADCNLSFPFYTNLTKIFLPAGHPTVEPSPMPSQIGFPGQTGLTIFTGELSYNSSSPQGDLLMKSWKGRILKRTTEGLVSISPELVFKAVNLVCENQTIASDSVLAQDSLYLQLDQEYVLSRGSTVTIGLTCDLNPNAPLGNYVIQFEDSSFIRFVDRNLSTTIYPALANGSYPLLTAEVSVVSNHLANSFTNYPNPFNPARGDVTTIAFVLSEDAYIDIEVFTITGELVRKLTVNSQRPAGSYQQDLWSGDNNSGISVLPGTYFCRITARYSSGKTETIRRKIAVIR